MKARSIILPIILILSAIALSACGPDLISPQPDDDTGEDSEVSTGEDSEVSEPQAAALAAEGSATLYYHYSVVNPDVDFNIEPVIPVTIAEGSELGSFDVNGIGQSLVTLQMRAGGGPQGFCHIQCQLTLNFAADGVVELDEVNGDCKLPLSFSFGATNNESILTGDCPDAFMETVNCYMLSAVMVDPSVYTFTKEFRELDLPADPGVTLRAEIKDVVMPADAQGICNW